MNRLNFNGSRLFKVFMNDILKQKRRLISASGGAAGILVMLFLLASLKSAPQGFFTPWYYIILFVGGYIAASNAFQDIHEKNRNYEFFMLPASMGEKFLSRLIMYGFLFPLYAYLLIFVTSAAASLFHGIFFGSLTPLFHPGGQWLFRIIWIFVVTQSVFLLGSLYFSNHAFFKTSIVLTVVQLLVFLIILAMLRLVFHNLFQNPVNFQFSPFNQEDLIDLAGNYFRVLKFVFLYLTAPFLWVLSLLKLEESEV